MRDCRPLERYRGSMVHRAVQHHRDPLGSPAFVGVQAECLLLLLFYNSLAQRVMPDGGAWWSLCCYCRKMRKRG